MRHASRSEEANSYTRGRLDRISEDVAVTRTKVEAIERHLKNDSAESLSHRERLGRLERRVFAIWIVGPILISAAIFLQTLKTWISEQ